MTHPHIEHFFEAFLLWAFEVPPIARASQHMTSGVVHLANSPFPVALLIDEAFPVVGIMPSG
jgi:hypothetical protein